MTLDERITAFAKHIAERSLADQDGEEHGIEIPGDDLQQWIEANEEAFMRQVAAQVNAILSEQLGQKVEGELYRGGEKLSTLQ